MEEEGFRSTAWPNRSMKQAAKSVKNIRSAWVQDQSCVVKGEDVVSYRLTLKVTFEVKS